MNLTVSGDFFSYLQPKTYLLNLYVKNSLIIFILYTDRDFNCNGYTLKLNYAVISQNKNNLPLKFKI